MYELYGLVIVIVVVIILLKQPANNQVVVERFYGYKTSSQNCVDKDNYTAFITPGHHGNKLPKKLGPPHFGRAEYSPNMKIVNLIHDNAI